MNKRVLVIGELNIDLILNGIAGFPTIGTEKIANNLDLTLGSSSAIFAANISSLGTPVSYLGMVGEDNFGDFIVESLTNKNVDTTHIIRSKNSQTGLTVVLNYDMDRAMVTYPGAMEELSLSHIDIDLLSKFDHVHISSVFLQPNIKKDLVAIFNLCKKAGLTTSMDPQWDPAEEWDLNLSQVLPLVDVFLPNIKEFLALTKTSSLEDGLELLKDYADRIVIKDGEKGAHSMIDGKLETVEAFLNSDVIDCIGAGDSFDAGFVFQFLKKVDKKSCLEFANIIGAINTTGSGGTEAFSSKDQIIKIASDNFSHNIEL